jgi:valyl-tRNA synthetase
MDENLMPSRYDAISTEPKWYACWEEAGLFQPDPDDTKPKWSLTIPPPNITGSLHMGHALTYPIQDMLGRYARLRGHSVLILPGQDHAGIATQSVVSKNLSKQGISAASLGREKFLEKVWEWRKESGDTILRQFRSLGCSFDWSRSRFTLDAGYHDAVLKVFIDWFDRGLIFRGKRVVNWDPVLRTSVSDIETERKSVRGKLYHIRYPFADGSGEVIIATTRPETMLADVAVAVHPSDDRYTGKVGKKLILPLVGREIPLIADIYPDPAFGTGAVKITPAHDPNDFMVGQRHQLDMPVILDERAKVTMPGPYDGMDRYDARKQIVADLEEQGFLVKVEDHDLNIIVSERSGEVIEPLLSEQWFVDQAKLAEPAIRAFHDGKFNFYPERYNRIFLDWMENIREWCISRQLWWGHRIPIYYTEDGTPIAAMSQEDAAQKAGGKAIVRQDDDVLDTWFSSGLWPFATFGWPEKTADLAAWYPTNVLVTDRNIINLWVARMLMMGIDFMGEVPFSEIMIHATVLTEDGRRMSKSLGTGIDPMTIIETKGADALRWTLLSQTGENQDIRYSDRKTDDARNFANKIWNATRFVIMNLDVDAVPSLDSLRERLQPVDRWLLSRLKGLEEVVRASYDGFDLQSACQALYRFFWSELCDWYIEVCKSRLQDESEKIVPQTVLLTAIESFLVMLHPIMPHLTEELYSHLPIAKPTKFIMVHPWPEMPSWFASPEDEASIERTFEMVRALRALRADLDLTPGRMIDEVYVEGDISGSEGVISSQAWVSELVPGMPVVRSVSTSRHGVDFHIPVEGVIDVDKLIEKLDKEYEKKNSDWTKLTQKLSNPQFIERAKPEVVEADRKLMADLLEDLAKIEERKRLLRES